LVALGDKRTSFQQSRAGLSGLEQNIWALKMDGVRYQHKWQFQKMWSWSMEEYPLKR
jgi:hypothetical protein